jgi:hypothetical protein
MRPRKETLKVRLIPLTGYARGFTARVRTLLRQALTIRFDVPGHAFLIDTDIPCGVPPVIRQRSQVACRRLLRQYPFERIDE